MRYATAVRRLRTIAEACDRTNRIWDEPVLIGAYVFGGVLDGAEEVPYVQVAFVIDRPGEEVTWWAEPPHGRGIAQLLDLEKALTASFQHRTRRWPSSRRSTTRASPTCARWTTTTGIASGAPIIRA